MHDIQECCWEQILGVLITMKKCFSFFLNFLLYLYEKMNVSWTYCHNHFIIHRNQTVAFNLYSEVKSLSHVWLFATQCTVAYQASQSIGFSRQEYWSGAPLPSLHIILYRHITSKIIFRAFQSFFICLRLCWGLPWRLSGKELTCQCRRHGLDPWSGRIPYAAEPLSPCATTIEPLL